MLLSASGSSALNRNQTDPSIGTRLAWWLRGSIRKLVLIISKPLAQSLKPVTIRTILTLVVSQGGDIRQLDMLNAFLNGELNEDVYMTHPTPLWIPNILHMFVSHKSHYGLKQSPRTWFTGLASLLQDTGFVSSKADTSFFIHNEGSITMYVLMYVDDILVTGNSS